MGYDEQMIDCHTDQVLYLKKFLELHAEAEGTFGAATASLRYGRDYRPAPSTPEWLRFGTMNRCFNNATLYAVGRDDVWYAEGYAVEPELPLPVPHAWLVNSSGQVIDPTWPDTRDHTYFGVAFETSFLRETLVLNENVAGLLVNLHLIRRRHRGPGALENLIKSGTLSRD
jgi:hypothetical protein